VFVLLFIDSDIGAYMARAKSAMLNTEDEHEEYVLNLVDQDDYVEVHYTG
jgi:hypothetical protein